MYKFLSHLKNIVYIVFGVKPDLTFNIIRQWMEMEANMNLITGKCLLINLELTALMEANMNLITGKCLLINLELPACTFNETASKLSSGL